ncbi:hypothetical protein B0J14DRAFT_18101 [Halenospora varia]|nr:hypothetical protein B0J14DRAFT_18101 [Halenospora varia]
MAEMEGVEDVEMDDAIEPANATIPTGTSNYSTFTPYRWRPDGWPKKKCPTGFCLRVGKLNIVWPLVNTPGARATSSSSELTSSNLNPQVRDSRTCRKCKARPVQSNTNIVGIPKFDAKLTIPHFLKQRYGSNMIMQGKRSGLPLEWVNTSWLQVFVQQGDHNQDLDIWVLCAGGCLQADVREAGTGWRCMVRCRKGGANLTRCATDRRQRHSPGHNGSHRKCLQ